MKKLFLSLLILFLVSNCVVLDNLGLNLVKDSIRGSEAKNQILTNALIGASLSGSNLTFASAQATYNTKGLRDYKFYNKKDVDDCAQRILIVNMASNNSANFQVAVGSFACDPIEENKTFIDWPIPLF